MKLNKNTAHIWFANLDTIKIDYAVLSDAEKIRASKMRLPEHQHRTAAARYVLRMLLKKYLSSLSPLPLAGEVRVREKGKLYLPDSNLRFNLAHSHEYAVFAFALDIEIGIDIEQQRDVEFDGIAKRVMSETEYTYWSMQPITQQAELFFQIWTRKEALVKATGDGLSGPLKDLSTIDSDGNICTTVNYANQTPLYLTDLSAPKNYYAALASAKSLQSYCYYLLQDHLSRQAEIF
jgi:4'-phosphopantetheinyl transferase